MTGRRDRNLGNDGLATDRAQLSFRQSRLRTTCRLAGQAHFGMPHSGILNILPGKLLSTVNTIYNQVVGTALGARTGNHIFLNGIFYAMILCRNRLLCNQYLTADRALLTLGKAILGAGSFLTGEDLFGMACGDHFLGNQGQTATGASDAFGLTVGGAGRFLAGQDLLLVGSGDHFLGN